MPQHFLLIWDNGAHVNVTGKPSTEHKKTREIFEQFLSAVILRTMRIESYLHLRLEQHFPQHQCALAGEDRGSVHIHIPQSTHFAYF